MHLYRYFDIPSTDPQNRKIHAASLFHLVSADNYATKAILLCAAQHLQTDHVLPSLMDLARADKKRQGTTLPFNLPF